MSIYDIIDGHLTIIDDEVGVEFRDAKPMPEQEARFDKEGHLLWQGYFVNALLHGPSKYYFANGNLSSLSWYVEGKKMGKAQFYSEEGHLLHEASYRHGKLQGSENYYYSNGALKAQLMYEDGLLDGMVSLYYPHGALQRTLSLKNGKRHGTDRSFDEKGKECFAFEYHEGRNIKTLIDDPIEIRYQAHLS